MHGETVKKKESHSLKDTTVECFIRLNMFYLPQYKIKYKSEMLKTNIPFYGRHFGHPS